MPDDFEVIKNMIDVFKTTHDIEGNVINHHVLMRIVELFIEYTGSEYEDAFRRVVNVLEELGYHVAY